jgi:hypothetical protein
MDVWKAVALAFAHSTATQNVRPMTGQFLSDKAACAPWPYGSTMAIATRPGAHAMSRFRFSLLGLAGLVALIALGCASLAYASPAVSGIAWSVALLTMMFATVAAAVSAPAGRSWWIGFAIFGWLYVFTLVGPLSGLSGWVRVDSLLEKLATKMPKATLTNTAMPPHPMGMAGGVGPMAGGMADGEGMPGGEGMYGAGAPPGLVMAPTPNTDYILSFIRTGQALLTLLLACLGGFAGRLVYERNRKQHGL